MTEDLLIQSGGGVMFMMALGTFVRVGMVLQPEDVDDPRILRGLMFTTFMLLWGMWFLSYPVGGMI